MSKSKIKIILIAFFDRKGLVNNELVPEGETVNLALPPADSYSSSLPSDKLWSLHLDNAPVHNATSVRQHSIEKQITVFGLRQHSPD